MASGDTLATFTPLHNEPEATNFATIDTRDARPVLDFFQDTDESAIFTGILPQHYGGSGITVTLEFAMSSAAAGNVMMTTAFERLQTGTLNLDASGFATAVASAATAVAGTSGLTVKLAQAHTDGAQIDSLAVGETFRLKVTRDANHASDTATGDLELVAVELKET